MNYLEVSAKTGKGVSDAFSQMGLKVYEIMKNKGAALPTRTAGASVLVKKPKAKEAKNKSKKRRCLVMWFLGKWINYILKHKFI